MSLRFGFFPPRDFEGREIFLFHKRRRDTQENNNNNKKKRLKIDWYNKRKGNFFLFMALGFVEGRRRRREKVGAHLPISWMWEIRQRPSIDIDNSDKMNFSSRRVRERKRVFKFFYSSSKSPMERKKEKIKRRIERENVIIIIIKRFLVLVHFKISSGERERHIDGGTCPEDNADSPLLIINNILSFPYFVFVSFHKKMFLLSLSRAPKSLAIQNTNRLWERERPHYLGGENRARSSLDIYFSTKKKLFDFFFLCFVLFLYK